MERYKVILAYDGTRFSGFQRLSAAAGRGAKRSVQGEVETALVRLGWKDQSILSAGRTDTGVHASGQVVTFDLDWQHSTDALCRALNDNLPQDVSAGRVEVVGRSFHPRYDAISRRYRYQLFCRPKRDPLNERYAWRVWPAVEPRLLDEAAARLVGNHDYKTFGSPPKAGGTTLRTVLKACWEPWQGLNGQFQDGDGLQFEIVANAFLYHMVRHLVFTQVQIGQGKMSLEDLDLALREGVLRVKGLAPAHGLTLVEVNYD